MTAEREYLMVLKGPLDTGAYGFGSTPEKALDMARKYWKLDFCSRKHTRNALPCAWALRHGSAGDDENAKPIASGRFTSYSDIIKDCLVRM